MVKSTLRHPRAARRLHPLAVRIMHWINALAIIAMIGSGWRIYNDEVLVGWLHFPDWATLGTEPQVGLQWHFFFMWILMLNGLAYLAYGIASGRFGRKLFPISPREVLASVRDALHFKLAHDDIRHYNAVQKLLYLGIIVVVAVQVISGLAIWKPVQFSELYALFRDFQTARLVHFSAMLLICGFLIIHVALAALVPRTIAAMITGGPPEEASTDDSNVVAPASRA